MAKPSIFKPVDRGGDWHLNAVAWTNFSDHALAMGFAETADVIVNHWRDHGMNDLLFVPLVYNHRHALELVLKAAIRETAARLRLDGDTDPKIEALSLDQGLGSRRRVSDTTSTSCPASSTFC